MAEAHSGEPGCQQDGPAQLRRPLIIISDLHLTVCHCEELIRELVALIRCHPEHELIFNGDTFSLSADADPSDPLRIARAVLKARPDLTAAFREHLSRGAPLTFIAGNHDAALTVAGAREELLRAIGVCDPTPFTIAPWFVRRGSVHVEHGHVYDPDNAPHHPLAPWRIELEPLGVALTRQLVVPFGAYQFDHAHETTPLGGLLGALRCYGGRGIRIAVAYLVTAVGIWARAGNRTCLTAVRGRVAPQMCHDGGSLGVSPEQIERLLRLVPTPTHHRRWLTFRRLYLDRVLASCLSGLAIFGVLSSSGLAWVATLSVASLYLIGSVLVSGNRYRGLTERRLRAAAKHIEQITAATLVIFGHSHRVEETGIYRNTGRFAGVGRECRPYLVVETSGVSCLGRW